MKESSPPTIYLRNYRAPIFTVLKTDLLFELEEEVTHVTSTLTMKRLGEHGLPLELHGQDLELVSIKVDGENLAENRYQVGEESLVIDDVPDVFRLECVTRIYPHKNDSLEGLYKSRTMFCTQCEAEGFRKITYYLDRPDVLSVFTTTIKAHGERYPVLLSNGDLIASETEGDITRVTWHDPHPKPSYLFALVAGQLACVEDDFTTRSGRRVALKIFVEDKDLDKCDHAMRSLKNAMRWDEDVYGREYDLDTFMIVAVDDFNMGAMENKGLNIFNTSCVLANPLTTTDTGFQRVEAVVAHEYFHNWSGNRVTCRDWFQLSLKEGFTVFRDAEFSADMGSRTVKRVEDVQLLRTLQFAEDAGPMAHPVQPDSFIEISNFYTLTIYEKGAEVVRMLHTLLGPELFRKGADLYFERHDGHAVTIEDFVSAMAEASGRDLMQFMLWYRQAGTPLLQVTGLYDEMASRFHLSFKQLQPDTPEAMGHEKSPLHIPVAIGLLGKDGALDLHLSDDTPAVTTHGGKQAVLELTQAEQTFVFHDVSEHPVPSLLRNFSAPVKLQYPYCRDDLLRLIQVDDDVFNRCDASQQLGLAAVHDLMDNPEGECEPRLVTAYRDLLENKELDPAMVAYMLELPTEAYLAEVAEQVDVAAIHGARTRLQHLLAQALEPSLLETYHRCEEALPTTFDVTASSIALRSLKNKALKYLLQLDRAEYQNLCKAQFEQATNMTDELAAMTLLVHSTFPSTADMRQQILDAFYDKWQEEPLVVNQWLAVQASSPGPNTLQQVKSLMKTAAFDARNPNKVRSLIGAFAGQNPINFHHESGEGYEFLAEQILTLDRQNPQLAARLVMPLSKWRRFAEHNSQLMKSALESILSEQKLSKDVYEVVSKSLKD